MEKDQFLALYNAGNKNAVELLEAANVLCETRHFPQAYVLAYTALEEISKSQFAADVFTGLKREEDFKISYRSHQHKLANIGWAHYDATTWPHKYKWVGPDMDDVTEMNPEQPLFSKRQDALYVGVDFNTGTVFSPT